jgi:hypothetical protein
MSIDIEKHIETLKKEAVKYWGESEQNGLIQRTLQALEQQQARIEELEKENLNHCRKTLLLNKITTAGVDNE